MARVDFIAKEFIYSVDLGYRITVNETMKNR